jgi:hypothetical protein
MGLQQPRDRPCEVHHGEGHLINFPPRKIQNGGWISSRRFFCFERAKLTFVIAADT